MDPATVAALSGAPATVVLAYFILALLRYGRLERRDFLRALERLRVTIERQSALLLTAVEYIAPGRGKAIQQRVTELFQQRPAAPEDHEHGEDS